MQIQPINAQYSNMKSAYELHATVEHEVQEAEGRYRDEDGPWTLWRQLPAKTAQPKTAQKSHTLEMSSDHIRIRQMLSKEEWESFIPIVQNEQVYIVNQVSGNTFGKPKTVNNGQKLFSLKGYTFTQNPLFPVELGDQFIISDEEK